MGPVDYSRDMKVIETVQGMLTPDAEPVEIVYARDTDAIGVMLCVAQILDKRDSDLKFVKSLSIRIEM